MYLVLYSNDQYFQCVVCLFKQTDAEFLSDFQNITTTIRTKTFTSTERNFITPLRAMEEYLLQPHDLGGLRRTFRRSPHVDEPPILVYWRRDVESRYVHVRLSNV